MTPKLPKPKKCKICHQTFQPSRMIQPVCDSYECKVKYAEAHALKANKKRIAQEATFKRQERKKTKEARLRIKTRSEWMKEAQIAFNAYIRQRDRHQRCICCEMPLVSGDIGGKYDCGHYRSVGSAPHLRFDERNAHAQRKQCNRWGSGRAVDYRMGLIKRIGLEAVEALEADQAAKHYTIDDLIALKAHYTQRCKELIKLQGE